MQTPPIDHQHCHTTTSTFILLSPFTNIPFTTKTFTNSPFNINPFTAANITTIASSSSIFFLRPMSLPASSSSSLRLRTLKQLRLS